MARVLVVDDDPVTLDLLREVANDAMDEFAQGEHVGHPVLWELKRAELLESLLSFPVLSYVAWLGGTARPTSGVARLRLVPIETVPTGAHQQALWGGSGAEDERAHRALARVQTLLGHGSVLVPAVQGGRGPGQRTRLTSWGEDPEPIRSPEQPWPGRIPAPVPTVLIDPPRPVSAAVQMPVACECRQGGLVVLESHFQH